MHRRCPGLAIQYQPSEPDGWDGDTIEKGQAFLAEWMEFKYRVAELRTEYLMDKRFSDSE